MADIAIRSSRLSFVSSQAFFGHAFKPHPNPVPWKPPYYTREFNRIRGSTAQSDFRFPWRSGNGAGFWRFAANGLDVGTMTAGQAWDRQFPLRIVPRNREEVKTDSPDERVFFDCFAYACGLVVTITIQFQSSSSRDLTEWRERSQELRTKRIFTLQYLSGATSTHDIEGLAKTILDSYRLRFYGTKDGITASYAPLSLNTVIQASGWNQGAPIDDALNRTLYAVTAWPKNWDTCTVPDLLSCLLDVRSTGATEGDAFYAVGRGRTLWRPALFSMASTKRTQVHTLSCLSHNVLSSLVHAEAMRLFALAFSNLSDADRRQLNSTIVGESADLLEDIYRGKSTYRSYSARRVVEDNNSWAEVNALRQWCEVSLL